MPKDLPMKGFTPQADSTRAFRDALGRFATGVTVVTAPGPVAMVANSFAAVSLDPPLVLWSPARASSRFDGFAAARHFAVHVLGAEQVALTRRFAHAGEGFDADDLDENPSGVPLLRGCLARFECEQHAVHEGGDHLIIVGRVLRAALRDGDPLIFAGGRYGHLANGA